MGWKRDTGATGADVARLIATAPRGADAEVLCELMARVSGDAPRLWGAAVIGFGRRKYQLAGGRQGEFMADRLLPAPQRACALSDPSRRLGRAPFAAGTPHDRRQMSLHQGPVGYRYGGPRRDAARVLARRHGGPELAGMVGARGGPEWPIHTVRPVGAGARRGRARPSAPPSRLSPSHEPAHSDRLQLQDPNP